MTITGQLKYMLNDKWSVISRGNVYQYQTKTLTRAYHRPNYDATFTAVYNLKSKFIVRSEIYVFGEQWTLEKTGDVFKPKQISGWVDVNLECEYRYSRMLGFFVRFNNIASQRYYRWAQYPAQRFGFMAGLSFVPF